MRILITVFTLLMVQNSYASVVPVDGVKKTDNFLISYLYDQNSELTINDISHIDFKQTIPNQFALGYKSGTAWFKITVE
ncbi:MAG: GGDEF domain-containing protein, partial [Gammaproteobacteria bacterium]|nr:GGDEF domain-containing protein [Gammaproteobacteria bacterium]